MKNIPSIFVLVMSTAILLLNVSASIAGADSAMGFTPLSNSHRDPWSSTIQGHQIKISYGTQTGHKISVDGKIVGDGYFLNLIGQAEVDGVPVVFGTTEDGAQRCDQSAPFVLSLPQGRPVNYAQVVDTEKVGDPDCVIELGAKVFNNRIVFSSKAVSTLDGKSWQWTPKMGFSKQSLTSFVPKESSGWRDLSDKKIKLAYELLDKSDIAPLLFSAAKQPEKFGEKGDFVQAFGKSFPGEYINELFIANGSYSDSLCGVFVALDYKKKKIYEAWSKDDSTSPVIIDPATRQWPKLARERLTKWLADCSNY